MFTRIKFLLLCSLLFSLPAYARTSHFGLTPRQFSELKVFIVNDVVVASPDIDKCPYVVAPVEEHVFTGTGDQIYVRGLEPFPDQKKFIIFRRGMKYIDPTTKKTLGYAGIYIGEAKVLRMGDPAKLLLIDTPKEVVAGDRLVPKEGAALNLNFRAHPARQKITGQIVNIVDIVTDGGDLHRVILNRGKKQGVALGDVFGIYKNGATIPDPYTTEKAKRKVALPKEREGSVMVYRVFDSMSVGLVISTTHFIHEGDWIGPYYIPKKPGSPA